MIYNLGLFSSIWSAIHNAIEQCVRTLFGWLTTLVYNFIVDEYRVFIYISRAEILKDETIELLYRRVGLILGMFMLFKLTFSFIQFLIEPNKFDDNNKGFAAIIKRTVISIVLLGITPSLFRMAFDLQKILIDENVVYKLIVGPSTKGDTESFGSLLASNIYFSFYREAFEGSLGTEITYTGEIATITDDDGNVTEVNIETKETWDFNKMKEMVETGDKNFNYPKKFLFVRARGNYAIDFDGLFCLATGILVAWLLITYCIQIATRVIQLAYLQLIAPVPILSYITDPDGAFKKWLKQCLTTYLDLFIRLAILYFIILVSREVMDNFSSSESTIIASTGIDPNDSALIWVKIFIIIGLLSFGKRAPELLKDLFPNLGGGVASLGFGMKSPKKTINDIPLASKAIGFAGNTLKKGARYVDRKVHHLPKPRGKFGQAIDKLLPGYAEARNDKIKAMEEQKKYNKYLKDGENLYNKYTKSDGKLDEKMFDSTGYQKTYLALESAKAENKQAEAELKTEEMKRQAAYNSGNQAAMKLADERCAIAKKNMDAAAGKLKTMQAEHDISKRRYKKDAEREEKYDYYKKTHSERKDYPEENHSETRKEKLYHKIAQAEKEKGEQTFSDAERQAEAQRRESQRSSSNNEYESQLASQSIFSDNEAMRQSDMEYNTGVSRPNASDNGAPTAENSIFNDANAMRDSDARYNQTQNNNNDTRVYQNGDDVGE